MQSTLAPWNMYNGPIHSERKRLLETEGHYLQDNAREMPVVTDPLYFVIDEKNRSVELA